MIMASHQTFSNQIKYLSSQIKLARQLIVLHIINGEVIELLEDNECLDKF